MLFNTKDDTLDHMHKESHKSYIYAFKGESYMYTIKGESYIYAFKGESMLVRQGCHQVFKVVPRPGQWKAPLGSPDQI